jgi:D-alanyl-D-alanine carboxypeptidase
MMRLERRRLFNTLALGFALLLHLALAAPAESAPNPAFTSDERYASIVVDADSGRVLMASNPDQIVHPASLTKIMTLYMTFDALKRGEIRLQQHHTVSSHAASMTP